MILLMLGLFWLIVSLLYAFHQNRPGEEYLQNPYKCWVCVWGFSFFFTEKNLNKNVVFILYRCPSWNSTMEKWFLKHFNTFLHCELMPGVAIKTHGCVCVCVCGKGGLNRHLDVFAQRKWIQRSHRKCTICSKLLILQWRIPSFWTKRLNCIKNVEVLLMGLFHFADLKIALWLFISSVAYGISVHPISMISNINNAPEL